MSKDEPQSEGMKALEQSLNDHMEICRLQRKAKRLKVENARLKVEVERLRKAGDAMVDYIERTESNAYDIEADGDDRIAEWNAAKEGKQA